MLRHLKSEKEELGLSGTNTTMVDKTISKYRKLLNKELGVK